MGITSLLVAALKNLPWRTIAFSALERAPELFQIARDRFQKAEDQYASEATTAAELQARIAHLEKLILEQEEIIREQSAQRTYLEDRCTALETWQSSFKIISGGLLVAAMILLVLLLK